MFLIFTNTVFEWVIAGCSPAAAGSKQPRVRVIQASDVRPLLPRDVLAVVFAYEPSMHDIAMTLPSLIQKCDGIQYAFEYAALKRSTSCNKLSFSYTPNLVDPAYPDVVRGIICPNCTSAQTCYGHMRTVKGVQHPIFYCYNKLVHERYTVNPCVACLVCQLHQPLMDRLWHRCADMVKAGLVARFLAPNYRDRRAEECTMCGFSPKNVTCTCRFVLMCTWCKPYF